MSRYRPISIEVDAPTTLETAITVSDANVVKITNTSSSSPYLVTFVDDSGNTTGTMTMLGSSTIIAGKPKAWKLFAANAAVKFVSLSYPI